MVIGTGEVLRHTNVDVEFEAGEMRSAGAVEMGKEVSTPSLRSGALALPSALTAFTSK